MRSIHTKKRLFPGPETHVPINATEHLTVRGTADDFDFDYYMYSEAFEKWLVREDLDLLKKYHPDSYEKLEKLALRELMRSAISNHKELTIA
jgi:hypothetical protein